MGEHVAGKQKKVVSEQKRIQEKPQSKEEEQPNKGFSFIVGICIGMGIIILFVLLFSH